MLVYKSKYANAYYDSSKSLFSVVWKDDKRKMTEKTFKKTLTGYIEKILEIKPKYFLFDAYNVFFPISPELQIWMHKNSLEKTSGIIEKEAVLVSDDLIMYLSADQTLSEEKLEKTITKRKIFTDKETAMKWLFETD